MPTKGIELDGDALGRVGEVDASARGGDPPLALRRRDTGGEESSDGGDSARLCASASSPFHGRDDASEGAVGSQPVERRQAPAQHVVDCLLEQLGRHDAGEVRDGANRPVTGTWSRTHRSFARTLDRGTAAGGSVRSRPRNRDLERARAKPRDGARRRQSGGETTAGRPAIGHAASARRSQVTATPASR